MFETHTRLSLGTNAFSKYAIAPTRPLVPSRLLPIWNRGLLIDVGPLITSCGIEGCPIPRERWTTWEVSITLNSQRQLQILLFVQEDRVLGMKLLARWGLGRVAADPGVMPI